VSLAVPPVIVGAAVWLLATPQWLRFEYGRAGFPDADGFTASERLEAAVPSTLFLTRPSIAADDLAGLTHRGEPLYTTDEIAHLDDARGVAGRLLGAAGVGAAVLAAAAIHAFSTRRARDLARGVEAGGWLTLGLSVWVALFAAFAWRFAFVMFHETLFPQGNWQFAASSSLIRLFPEPFWMDSAAALLAFVALSAAGSIAVARRVRRRRG
jgi:hypothetical protein